MALRDPCVPSSKIAGRRSMVGNRDHLGRSRGEIVRDALRRQLSLIRFVQLQRQALPIGEAAGWFTDEDVFKAVS
jgi:hypothetical protein